MFGIMLPISPKDEATANESLQWIGAGLVFFWE